MKHLTEKNLVALLQYLDDRIEDQIYYAQEKSLERRKHPRGSEENKACLVEFNLIQHREAAWRGALQQVVQHLAPELAAGGYSHPGRRFLLPIEINGGQHEPALF